MDITGIILSGGKSLRMGQDKGLMSLDGKFMIEHVIDHIKPLCKQILISANQEEYHKFGYPVVRDEIKDIGPAGGIVSHDQRVRAPEQSPPNELRQTRVLQHQQLPVQRRCAG